MECTEFINLSNHLQAVRSKHEAFVSQPSPKEPSLEFDMHRSECRTLVKECNRAGIAYANAATYHLENDDPKLPIVNEHGTRLLPSTKLSGALATGVQGKDAIPKRVTFDETLEHPTRETSRDVSRAVLAFRRRTAAYVPGKYAEPEEGSWVNTCNPQLNDWREVDGLQSKEAMEPKREAPKAPKSTQQEGEEDPETGVHDARLDQDIEQVKLSMKTLSEDDSAGGGDQSTVLVQDADLAEFVDFVSSMLDPDELKQFEEDWMAEDHGDEDKDAGEEAQTAENAYQSDKESNDDASSPDEDDGPYQSDTGLSGSETIIASLKRSRDDEDEGWTLGDDHPDEERNRVFAIRLLTPDAARSRITYKTNGFTLPESEK